MLLKAVAGYHTSFLITLAIASHILAHSSSHSGLLYPNNYPHKMMVGRDTLGGLL